MSRYKGGHFLSPHSDKGNGKIAFVISLTKKWKPEYGGILHFMNDDNLHGDKMLAYITPFTHDVDTLDDFKLLEVIYG